MPYIPEDKRKTYAEALEYISNFVRFDNVGDLNYFITKILGIYVRQKTERYQTYNDILGVLEGVKLELYRRKIAEYENKKIKENGDVYE